MKIALVDDQQQELNFILDILKKELPAAKYDTFSSGEAFLKVWSAGAYDLILLDIFMGGMHGVDVARAVRETDLDVRIVFSTTSNEFASESYEVGANYYLHKPVSENSVSRMLKMLRLEHYEANRFIRLPDDQRVVLRNVIYTEYYNHTIQIYCKNGETIQTRMTQKDWESLLAEYPYFYSSAKGIVVNFYEVSKNDSSTFWMSDGSQVSISRRKSKEVLDRYTAFRFQQLREGGGSNAF